MIVGVNKYRPEKEQTVNVLQIDNTAVREKQIAKINRAKQTRDRVKAENALANLTAAAGSRQNNLLAVAIECARARCTVGEISDAMEKVSAFIFACGLKNIFCMKAEFRIRNPLAL